MRDCNYSNGELKDYFLSRLAEYLDHGNECSVAMTLLVIASKFEEMHHQGIQTPTPETLTEDLWRVVDLELRSGGMKLPFREPSAAPAPGR